MAANEKAVSVRLEPSRIGQRAHDMRLGPQPEYVDEDRSHLNRVLIEPLTNDALRAEWEEVKKKVGKKGKIRSNQNLSYAGIVAFGHEAQKIFETLPNDEQDYAFFEVGEEIAKHFNTRLTGMVFHRDETAPHAHFQIRGIADDGTMLSQVIKRAALRKVQDIAAEVMGRYAPGIERGKDKWVRIEEGEDFASTLNRSVKQLHEDLPAEIAAKEAELAELQKRIEAAEERRDKNVQRAWNARKKARANEKTAEKHLKNAANYERRAEAAEADVKKLAEKITSFQASIDILTAAEDDLCASLSDKNDEFRRLEAAEEALKEEVGRLEDATMNKKGELETVTNTVAQKKTKIAALESSNSSLRQRKASLQARLKTLNAA